MEEAINDIAGGAAICLVGAGFSWGAKDATGLSVPSVEVLCEEICRLAKLNYADGYSLSDLAEFCNDDPNLKEKLRTLLIRRLTLCVPSGAHKAIMQMPWRAVFTTNFDDVAERSILPGPLQVVTPLSDARELRAGTRPLYYLHGRALDFHTINRDPGLVLSETNYLELREKNRLVYDALVNETHAASRVFFIGYSLRDAEIATRLFSIEGLKEKSVVICGPDEKPVTLNRLKKFGATYPIGVDSFASTLPEPSSIPSKSDDIGLLGYVGVKKKEGAKQDLTNEDVEALLIAGKFDYSAYASQQRALDDETLYCVPREQHLKKLFQSGASRFIVTSDLGNGKSVFLEQLTFEAHRLGYEVFSVHTQLPEALTELDLLLASNKKRIYLVDGFVRYRKAVKHIGSRLPPNSILVVATNEIGDDNFHYSVSEEMGGAAREIDLNVLDNSEILAWDRLLERWGFWQDRIEDEQKERLSFLRDDCSSENRSIMLALFKKSKLSATIERTVSFFVQQYPEHQSSFIAVLINALCQNHVEWSRIVGWLNIDTTELKRAILSSPIGEIMKGRREWHKFTSTELASYILNNFSFDFDEIIKTYTKIVRETAYSSDDYRGGFDSRENLKELMRYRFLTRLFTDKEIGLSSINAVYQQLSKVPRIRNNDQFWLQFAMARMEVGDLDGAEGYLSTALGLAGKKGEEYSKRQILDQQARLIFRKASQPKARIVKSDILQAIQNLNEVLADKKSLAIYPLRSSKYLLNFLEEKADKLDASMVEALLQVWESMDKRISGERIEKSKKGETAVIRKQLREIKLILSSL